MHEVITFTTPLSQQTDLTPLTSVALFSIPLGIIGGSIALTLSLKYEQLSKLFLAAMLFIISGGSIWYILDRDFHTYPEVESVNKLKITPTTDLPDDYMNKIVRWYTINDLNYNDFCPDNQGNLTPGVEVIPNVDSFTQAKDMAQCGGTTSGIIKNTVTDSEGGHWDVIIESAIKDTGIFMSQTATEAKLN